LFVVGRFSMAVDRDILAILLFFYEKGVKAAAATREICDVKGEGVLSERAAQNWYVRFKSGDKSLERRSGSGRVSDVDDEALLDDVESDPCQSLRTLSATHGSSKSTIAQHLKALGKSSKSDRIVPHDLTDAQAARRLELCQTLLRNPLDDRFFKLLVTCDEKWVFLRSHRAGRQWLSAGEIPDPVPKRDRFEKKVMLSVFWNVDGPLYWELIPDGRTINSDVYCTQLRRVYDILKERYSAVVNRGKGLLLQDNAKPHTWKKTTETLESLEGVELLPHPPYSPDLSPSDYHLFRSMSHYLGRKHLDNLDHVKSEIESFFASKSKEWYKKGIMDLARRWVEVIDNDGLYFQD
jgi:[histone H3]-lysine36 N-dimethyltransferase SETMAR